MQGLVSGVLSPVLIFGSDKAVFIDLLPGLACSGICQSSTFMHFLSMNPFANPSLGAAYRSLCRYVTFLELKQMQCLGLGTRGVRTCCLWSFARVILFDLTELHSFLSCRANRDCIRRTPHFNCCVDSALNWRYCEL